MIQILSIYLMKYMKKKNYLILMILNLLISKCQKYQNTIIIMKLFTIIYHEIVLKVI